MKKKSRNLKQFSSTTVGSFAVQMVTHLWYHLRSTGPSQLHLGGIFYKSMSITYLMKKYTGVFMITMKKTHLEMKLYTG